HVSIAAADVMLNADTEEMTGGVVSFTTVTLTGAEVALLPAASRATAVKVCEPFEAEVVFQEIEKGEAVSSAPRLAPSSLSWTPATPTLSEAVAETVIVPETDEAEVGAVIETVGASVSEGVVPVYS